MLAGFIQLKREDWIQITLQLFKNENVFSVFHVIFTISIFYAPQLNKNFHKCDKNK